MTRAELEQMRKWVDDKLAGGSEPPWAWYQYMKLRETIDAIIAGMDATAPIGTGARQRPHLSVIGDDVKPIPVQLPM